MAPLTLAYSPCPNDTFIFTSWVRGHIPGAPEVVEQLADIDMLNSAALAGEPDIVKLSFHAYGHVRDRYALLRSGGALGRGCGPLIVAREAWAPAEVSTRSLAIPGRLTTAALLARLFAPGLTDERIRVMPFDHIMGAVADGSVDAGLIIHESRFTFPSYGLKQIVDLGDWWERETGHAIPLGAIAIKRSLGIDLISLVERSLAASVDFAFAHPHVVWPTVRRHAQEMDDEVMRQHIALYVNDFTRDYGPEGVAAIEFLLARAEATGSVPVSTTPIFVTHGF